MPDVVAQLHEPLGESSRAFGAPRAQGALDEVSCADLLTYLVFAIGYLAVVWYGLHLATRCAKRTTSRSGAAMTVIG